MLQKYIEDGWTHKRIAAFTGMHLSTIQRRMKKAPHLEILYEETAHLRINRAKLRKSAREQHVPEIARLTCQGYTLKDIAKMRGLTKSKVTHIKREFRELFLHYMETFNGQT
jgi:AraC-like DNA-binding protein